MCGKTSSVFTFLFATFFVVNSMDQCDNFDVTFYKGSAPNGFGGGKEIGELVGSLAGGLAKLFQQFNATTMAAENDTYTGVTMPAHSQMALEMKPVGSLGNLKDKLPFPHIMKNVVPPPTFGEKSNATHFGGMHFGGVQINAEATEESESESWGISIPLNTLKIEFAKLSKNKISDTFTIDGDFLTSNKTITDNSNFVKNVDLNEFKVTANDLYIVCLTMSLVKNDKQGSCQRCLLKRVCDGIFDSSCVEKFVTLQGPESKVHPTSAQLRYLVSDPPLPDMKLVTKLSPKSLDSRCNENNDSQPIEKPSKLFSNIVLYVEIDNISPKLTYTIQTNLQINWSDRVKAPFEWSNPLIIPDYLDGKKEYLIYACGKNAESVSLK